MLTRFRTAIIITLLGGATAAATGEATSAETPERKSISEEHKNDLLRAKTGLLYALVTYQSDAEACRGYVGRAA